MVQSFTKYIIGRHLLHSFSFVGSGQFRCALHFICIYMFLFSSFYVLFNFFCIYLFLRYYFVSFFTTYRFRCYILQVWFGLIPVVSSLQERVILLVLRSILANTLFTQNNYLNMSSVSFTL